MIHDLGIIMLTAGVTSLVCKFLKQPVVLGYIVAGLLVGPYVCGASWVHEEESVETWGQVGVIFLLFSLGLEFSFKKLVQMGSTAVIGCMTIVVGMMTTGFLLGRAMGWNEMNSLFLGGMLCMSSTTIVFKALDDLGLRQQKFAGICFGILVVEDLFAVVLMVLLASIAVKNTFDGQEMLWQVIKLVAYLLFWFVAGIMLIPTLLRKCKKHLNDETMTIVALGLCLGMVLLAEGAGFSAALGAFVMGSIMAETVEAEHIEHLISPVKNMFGAVFFVSVGMMIDPALLLEYWLPITLITFTVIIGQIIFASLGVVLSGEPLKTAMQSAFALTQVGEFAFIIANFGSEKGITEPYLYPVIVAVSVITTFLTPYVIKLSAPAYEYVDRIMPRRFKLMLLEYSRSRNTVGQESLWQRFLKKVGLSITLYTVTCIFLLSLYFSLLSPLLVDFVNQFLPAQYEWVGRGTSLILVFAMLLPLVYKIATKHLRSEEERQIWQSGSYHRGGIVLSYLLRIIISLALIAFSISQLFPATYGVLVALALAVVVVSLFSKRIQQHSSRIEQSFLNNLSAREAAQERAREGRRLVGKQFERELLTYDLHISDFDIPAHSSLCGMTLIEANFRQRSGVNVVRIVRGGLHINIPGGKERLYPGDRIAVAGTDEQIRRFGQMLSASFAKSGAVGANAVQHRNEPITLQQFVITASMPFCDKPLQQSRIGELTQCAVLAISHNGEVNMAPTGETILHTFDTVILAGEAPRIREFLAKYE